MNDQTLHKINFNEFPEPDVSVDVAWAKMELLLDSNAAAAKTEKNLLKELFLHVVSYSSILIGIVCTVCFVFLLNRSVPTSVFKSNLHTVEVPSETAELLVLDSSSSIQIQKINKAEEIVLLTGGAYFEMKNDFGSAVLTGAENIRVLPGKSASFYISNSINEKSKISVFVLEGGLLVITNKDTIHLHADEMLLYDAGLSKAVKQKGAYINSFSHLSHILNFNGTPVLEAFRVIEKTYGVKLIVNNKKLESCRITSRFDKKKLNEVLDILAYTLNFDYSLNAEKNEVFVKAYGCN